MTYEEFQIQRLTPKLNVLHIVLSKYPEESHYFGPFVVSIKKDRMTIDEVGSKALFTADNQDLELFGQDIDIFTLKLEYEIDKMLEGNKEFKTQWDKIVNI